MTMPTCEICGMEVIKVTDCSQCESKFCDECGDLKRNLCYDCVGWFTLLPITLVSPITTPVP